MREKKTNRFINIRVNARYIALLAIVLLLTSTLRHEKADCKIIYKKTKKNQYYESAIDSIIEKYNSQLPNYDDSAKLFEKNLQAEIQLLNDELIKTQFDERKIEEDLYRSAFISFQNKLPKSQSNMIINSMKTGRYDSSDEDSRNKYKNSTYLTYEMFSDYVDHVTQFMRTDKHKEFNQSQFAALLADFRREYDIKKTNFLKTQNWIKYQKMLIDRRNSFFKRDSIENVAIIQRQRFVTLAREQMTLRDSFENAVRMQYYRNKKQSSIQY